MNTGFDMRNNVNNKNWFERNWKWFVPTGCLTLIVVFALFIGGVFFAFSKIMKRSDVYVQAIELVSQNEECIQAMGEPIEDGWFFSGSIHVSGPSGRAELAIPVSGPKGEGTIYVKAFKEAGKWHFKILEVQIKGQEHRIKIIVPQLSV
jgi:hypothetical protein